MLNCWILRKSRRKWSQVALAYRVAWFPPGLGLPVFRRRSFSPSRLRKVWMATLEATPEYFRELKVAPDAVLSARCGQSSPGRLLQTESEY